MSNLARQLITSWSEDAATLLYDAPSRSSQRRAVSMEMLPPAPALPPTLGTRAGSGLFSQVQLIAVVVAAMVGAMVAARSTLARAPHGSTEPAPDKPSATAAATGVRAIAPPAAVLAPAAAPAAPTPTQKTAQPESKPLQVAQPAKVAPAATQDRRAERIAARPRSSARAQSRSGSAERNAQPAAAPQPVARTADIAPPRTPPQTAANRKGTLRINSRPWSKVYVDGRAIGNTPQMAIAVEPGTHKVKLVNKEFELERTVSIDVRAGQTVTRSIEMMQ